MDHLAVVAVIGLRRLHELGPLRQQAVLQIDSSVCAMGEARQGPRPAEPVGVSPGGHRVGHDVVGTLLKTLGYSLQGNRKTLEGSGHVDRDAQFGHIAETVKEAITAGQPAISVRATARTVETRALRIEASRDNAERLTLAVPGRDEPIVPTHWSYGQLCSLVGAPSSYMRQLPAPLTSTATLDRRPWRDRQAVPGHSEASGPSASKVCLRHLCAGCRREPSPAHRHAVPAIHTRSCCVRSPSPQTPPRRCGG